MYVFYHSLGRGCFERGARVDDHDGAWGGRCRGQGLHPRRESRLLPGTYTNTR